MLKRNVKLIAALAIVASLSAGGAVNAASVSNSTTKSTYHANKDFKKGHSTNSLKSKLDALVTAGTITNDQETAALNLIKPSKTNQKANHKDFFKNKLDTLVTAGTINKDQETAVLNLFTSSLTNTTKAEKKSEKKDVKNSLKTKLNTLVTAGTITKDQETAIENLFAPNRTKNTQDKVKKAQTKKDKLVGSLKTKLDTLVAAGTITQDQETAMINSLTSFTAKTSQK